MKDSCIECGVWGVVNGLGLCGRCDEDMRERSLIEKDNSYKDWLEEVNGMDVEVVSVEEVKW